MSWTKFSRKFIDLVKPLAVVVDEPAGAAPLTFVQFVEKVRPQFVWYRHCAVVARVLEWTLLADGPRRVMFWMPPRHGKSELVSRLWPAYLAYRFPTDEVGITSYSASLAKGLCADARGNYLQIGGKLDASTRAKHDWRTTFGGRVWAEGVGGSLTGKGFKWGIIDDPIKGAKESQSETIKRNLREWYQSVFYTRQAPDARIYVVNTRWAMDDLSGWQIDEERIESEDPEGLTENWYIVNLQAIRDMDEESEFPTSCTVEPDWRQHGQALCPERYPLDRLQRLMRRIGSYFWSALYQQSPKPKGGGILKSHWFDQRIHIDDIPKMALMVVGVDLAYKEKDGADWTVAMPMGRDAKGRYYLFRPYRVQATAGPVLDGIVSRTKEVKASVVGVEEIAAQSAYISLLSERKELSGVAIIGVPADMDKVTRALGWAPIAESKLITLVVDGTGWEQTFIDEAVEFPRGKKDQVDAVGMAVATMRRMGDHRLSGAADLHAERVKKSIRGAGH